jgi:hypothetical protein
MANIEVLRKNPGKLDDAENQQDQKRGQDGELNEARASILPASPPYFHDAL